MLNVRSKPTTKSVVLGKLKANDEVKVYSIVNSWAEIIYKNKRDSRSLNPVLRHSKLENPSQRPKNMYPSYWNNMNNLL